MKKIIFVLFSISIFSFANAQGILDKIKKVVTPVSSTGKGLSNDDIVGGLKQALSIGTDSASKRLHKTDAFFANAAIKILMPDEVKKIESTLRSVGLGSIVDKAILSMNRAAEDAAGNISPIFIDAIKQMTLTDGLKILQGGDFAATDYLKANTSTKLSDKMKPVIDSSLKKVGATQYWNDVFTAYNKIPLVKKPVSTNLSDYVTQRALRGIFYSISLEEQKIRKDPAAQVTSLLKKVFGK